MRTDYATDSLTSSFIRACGIHRERAIYVLKTITMLETTRFQVEHLAVDHQYDRRPSILLDHVIAWRDELEVELAELLGREAA